MNNKNGFIIMTVFVIAFLNMYYSQSKSEITYYNLKDVEALAGETSTPKYNKLTGDCSKTYTIDAQGYVTIRGKRIHVGGVSGEYSASYTDVKIDCPAGNKYYTCVECTCSNFWDDKC